MLLRGKTSLFGELVETREINQWDLLHTVLLADGKTTFEVATYFLVIAGQRHGLPEQHWPLPEAVRS